MDYGMGYGIFNRLCYETIYLLAYICSALYWPAVMHLPQSFEGQRSLKNIYFRRRIDLYMLVVLQAVKDIRVEGTNEA